MSYDFWLEIDAGGDEPIRLDPDTDWSAVEMPARVLEHVAGADDSGGRFLFGRSAVRINANYTSNVYRMWDLAIGPGHEDGLRGMNGSRCGDVVDALEHAVDDMIARPDVYREFNPANGWGNYEGALCYLAGIATYCRAHPDARLRLDT